MNIKALLAGFLFFGIGTANAVNILFVRNEKPGSTIVISNKSGEKVVIAAGEEKKDISLAGEATLEYGPANGRTKMYLRDEKYLGMKLGGDGHLYKSLTN